MVTGAGSLDKGLRSGDGVGMGAAGRVPIYVLAFPR